MCFATGAGRFGVAARQTAATHPVCVEPPQLTACCMEFDSIGGTVKEFAQIPLLSPDPQPRLPLRLEHFEFLLRLQLETLASESELAEFDHREEHNKTETGAEQARAQTFFPVVTRLQAGHKHAQDQAGRGTTQREAVRKDHVLEIDESPRDENGDENHVSRGDGRGKSRPQPAEKQRRKDLHQRIAPRNTRAATRTFAVQPQPTQDGDILIPRQRASALRTE